MKPSAVGARQDFVVSLRCAARAHSRPLLHEWVRRRPAAQERGLVLCFAARLRSPRSDGRVGQNGQVMHCTWSWVHDLSP
jgi:hypothetical protein